jgi:hypothetical protein
MASLRHFIGRERDIARLQRHLDAVVGEGQGRLLSIRGRRQAGKSRLVTEFADRTGLPQLFFTGARLAGPRAELARFALEQPNLRCRTRACLTAWCSMTGPARCGCSRPPYRMARRSSSWMSSLGCADPAQTLRVRCKSPGTDLRAPAGAVYPHRVRHLRDGGARHL